MYTSASTVADHQKGDSCWNMAGPFEKTCFHPEPFGQSDYPLTSEMLERSIPYEASDQQIHRVFEIARDRGVVNVVVIGGKSFMEYVALSGV